MLGFGDGAGFAFVVHPEDFPAELEFFAGGSGRDGFKEVDLALAVYDARGVELGDTGDCRAGEGARDEVDDFLICVLEREDDGVGGEGLEVGIELLGYDQLKAQVIERGSVRRGSGARRT